MVARDERSPLIFLLHPTPACHFRCLSLLIASVVLFVLLRLLPGDPANALLCGRRQLADRRRHAQQVGSDLPLAEQFVRVPGKLARFDLGTSFVSARTVGAEIAARLMVTVPLTLLASIFALVIAVPLGISRPCKADRWYGAMISVVSQLGIAIPVFWVGILLVTVFAVNLRLFPQAAFPGRAGRMWPSAFAP